MKRPPKKARAQELDYEAWNLKFEAMLRANLHAARSWKKLSGAGMEMREASFLLWLACDFDGSPGYEIVKQIGDTFIKRASEARRLAKRLESDLARIKMFFGQSKTSPSTDEISNVIKELHEVDLGIRDQLSTRNLNPSTFRAWLTRRVRETTGRSFYKELSFLLDAAYEVHGEEPPAFGADALRKSYQRFAKGTSDSNSAEFNPVMTLMSAFAVGLIMHAFRKVSEQADAEKKRTLGGSISERLPSGR